MAIRLDRRRELEVFVASVAAGGVSAGARRLGLPPSSVSRTIRSLETRIGVTLLVRGPRLFRLTPEGDVLFERGRRLLEEFDELEREVGSRGQPNGTVRVSVSVAFGRLVVLPLLAEFRQAYPLINLQLSLTDRYADLAGGEADVALRVGPLRDSDLIARKLAESPRVIVASPAYVAVAGEPQSPFELADHQCLRLTGSNTDPWPFIVDGEELTVAPSGNIEADDGESLAQLAIAGQGIARVGRFNVVQAIRSGQLVELLQDHRSSGSDVFYAVFLGGRAAPERIRAFVDFLAEKLAGREL